MHTYPSFRDGICLGGLLGKKLWHSHGLAGLPTESDVFFLRFKHGFFSVLPVLPRHLGQIFVKNLSIHMLGVTTV